MTATDKQQEAEDKAVQSLAIKLSDFIRMEAADISKPIITKALILAIRENAGIPIRR
jgi:hypothetical protein